MAGNIQADERARMGLVPLTGHLISDGRLGPAEAHRIVRLQLENLVARAALTPALDLSPSDGYRLSRQLHIHRYAAGEVILPRRAHADCLGLVVQGQVAVHTGSRGTVRPRAVLLPGSTFGQAMLMEGRPSGSTLQALTRCELWLLRRRDLQTLTATRRAERRAAKTLHLAAVAAVLLFLCLMAIVALSSRPTQQALATVPMRLGQWCYQRVLAGPGYERCAQEAWQVAASLAPADANPLVGLGGLYWQQGDMGRAEQAFASAQLLAPDSAEVYNSLGLIYASQGEHERAIAAFRWALELEPGVAVTEHNLGRSLHAVEAYDEALFHYQLALVLDEPRASTLVNMAIAYYETGQMVQAADAARKALAYDETSVPAYTVLGAVALQSWQPKEALPALRRATELDADYFQAQFYLGQAYKALGQPSEAVAAFEQALIRTNDTALRHEIRRYLDELYEIEGQRRSP